jgi:polysaccharide export outer membrane protein
MVTAMKTLSLFTLRAAFGALFGVLALITQGVAATAPSAPVQVEAPKAIAYRIAPSDKLSIAVIGEPELNAANKRVDASGNINLALVLDVRVAGLTVSEAQTAVENAYKDGRILRNPQVSINIEEYSPREVSISGMIKIPGKYPLPPETVMTLKDLVLKAGGFTDTASGTKVKITRTSSDGTAKIYIKDIDSLLRGRQAANSTDGAFPLEPGDLVYVPEKII